MSRSCRPARFMPSRRSEAATSRRMPQKLATARMAPTATPTSTGVEKNAAAPRIRTPAKMAFQRSILASSLGPIGLRLVGCRAGGSGASCGGEHTLETGGDTEEQEDQHQPGAGAE